MFISKFLTVILVIASCLLSKPIKAQDFIQSPLEGKAVVYFVRSSALGFAMNFRFFEGTKYLGKFNGVNYLRYECDPGKRVFWVKAENIDFVEAELKEGGIYFLLTNASMGAISAGAKISLVDYTDEKAMSKILKVIQTKSGISFTNEELKLGENKMASVINSGAYKVQRKLMKGKKVKKLSPDMTYQLVED